ncbi:MAG: phospholipid carrier-dependent glycosyltransferase [Phycisphaerae bacterium]|jgi:hypothetical protein
MTDKPRASRRPAWSRLAVVLCVGLSIRLYLALTAALLSRDGVTFIWYAQKLSADPAGAMRAEKQHPLYPAMILGAHRVIQAAGGMFRPLSGSVGAVLDDPVRCWTLAGMSVTLAGGLAVIVAVYALAALLFDRRVGVIAAGLAALAAEFCQLSADALSDMPHLALYLFSLCCGVRALRSDAAREPGGNARGCSPRAALGWLFLAGALSGLAYLVRPEGSGAGLVAAIGTLIWARTWPPRRRLAGCAVVCLGVALMACPYMIVTGKIVQKKSILKFFSNDAAGTRFMRFENRSQIPGSQLPVPSSRFSVSGFQFPAVLRPPVGALGGSWPRDLFRAGGLLLEHWCRAMRVAFLLPAILWLLMPRRRAAAEGLAVRLVAAGGALHIVVSLALILRFNYWELFSVRHAAILAALTLPFSAAGLAGGPALAPAVAARLGRNALTALLLAGLTAPTLPWMLEKRNAAELHLRRAGEWIRTQQPAGAKVHTNRFTVAFYANGEWLWSPDEDDVGRAGVLDRVLVEARVRHPDWLVFDERRMMRISPTFFTDLEGRRLPGETIERAAVSEHDAKRARQRAIVYRYRPPPS